MESAVREFAVRYTAAWCSQDPARVAFFSPEGSLQINDGAPSVGRAAITEAARSFMSVFPDLCVSMDELVAHGDRYEYRWTLTGSSGARSVRISGYEDWRLGGDGLITISR